MPDGEDRFKREFISPFQQFINFLRPRFDVFRQELRGREQRPAAPISFPFRPSRRFQTAGERRGEPAFRAFRPAGEGAFVGFPQFTPEARQRATEFQTREVLAKQLFQLSEDLGLPDQMVANIDTMSFDELQQLIGAYRAQLGQGLVERGRRQFPGGFQFGQPTPGRTVQQFAAQDVRDVLRGTSPGASGMEGRARAEALRAQATGGTAPAGGGALTAASMGRSQRMGNLAKAEQKDILSELQTLDPELAKSMRDLLLQMTMEVGGGRQGRGADVGPISPQISAAIAFERNEDWLAAKRVVEEERWFEFGDVYGLYLEYRNSVSGVPIGFKEWREQTPAVQAILREREEFETRQTVTAEQRIRPPRFATARQRGV